MSERIAEVVTTQTVAAVGGLLGERYLVQEVVGQGTYGRVFRAQDTLTSRPVALKEFVRSSGNDGFLREIGVLFELQHPSVIECYSLAMAGAYRYVVYEFMESGSLRDYLETGTGSVREGVRLLLQAAHGVAYAHERNIIHRDLKPENILLGRRDGQLVAKVSDFGISTMATSCGARSSIGSPAYMAPEQFYDQYDARVDVYALGVMLYEIICGKRPFYGSPAQLMLCHLKREVEIPLWLPKGCGRLFRKALAKRPDRRFVSVRRFIEALELMLATDGEALDGHATIGIQGDIAELAATRDDLLARSGNVVFRYDHQARLIDRMEEVDTVLAAECFYLVRGRDQVRLRTPSGQRSYPNIPKEARVALSRDGAIALTLGTGVSVYDLEGRNSWLPYDGKVTDCCFLGDTQTLCVATRDSRGSWLHLGDAKIQLPKVGCGEWRVWGHNFRAGAIARPMAGGSESFLITPQTSEPVVPLRIEADSFCSDAEHFFSVTPAGELATIGVQSRRMARTQWDAPLAAVASCGDLFGWATRNRRLVQIQRRNPRLDVWRTP